MTENMTSEADATRKSHRSTEKEQFPVQQSPDIAQIHNLNNQQDEILSIKFVKGYDCFIILDGNSELFLVSHNFFEDFR